MLPQDDLSRLVERPDEQIDLGLGALLLARSEYPNLDPQAGLAQLNSLAEMAEPHVRSFQDENAKVGALRAFLAEECGFQGNVQDYYNPRNSCLNYVLDRHTGIPITLSVVYIEVGRRLGLTLFGVGLPGHFVVKFQGRGEPLFLDPFNGGRTLSKAACQEMVQQMYEGKLRFEEEFLAAVDKRYILLRMLNNLRGIYLQGRQFRKALSILQMVLAIDPSSEDLKQRGLIHYALRNYRLARQDLESYLSHVPQPPDSEQVQQILAELKKLSAMMN